MIDSVESLGKLKLENFILTLMYGKDTEEGTAGDYEEKIKNSYEEFHAKLEMLYEKIDREDNRLFEMVSDFAEIHDEVYFKVGFLTGVKLVKCLDSMCGKGVDSHLGMFFDNGNKRKENHLGESVLHQFIQTRMGTALEETLRKDVRFQEWNFRNSKIRKEMEREDFTPEQWEAIDAVLAENNDSAAEYGEMAYRQGALDLFCLFKELSI